MKFAAVKFAEAVAKRASTEGWKLLIAQAGFIWRKDKDYPIDFQSFDPRQTVHGAMAWLDDHEKWNTSVEL